MRKLVGGRRKSRKRLLGLVQARLERFDTDHDPSTVLDSEAVAELTALLETVPDPTADLEIAYAAGWLHWLRYLVLDPGDGRQDFGKIGGYLPSLGEAPRDRRRYRLPGSALSRCVPACLTCPAAAYRTGTLLWSHSWSHKRPSPGWERALTCGN